MDGLTANGLMDGGRDREMDMWGWGNGLIFECCHLLSVGTNDGHIFKCPGPKFVSGSLKWA